MSPGAACSITSESLLPGLSRLARGGYEVLPFASVAGLMITTEAMVAELPKDEAPAGGGGGGGMGGMDGMM